MDRTPETTHKTVTVLVVEDSATQREELRFVLEESGYTVVVASDGRDGLAAARTNAIDLVISDIVMPEMDGYALCKALRTDEKLQHLPVILLTSLTDPRDVIRGLESGANNFICKPYAARALVVRVQNVLANQEIRKVATSEMGISILFAGQRFFITADRLQILDLLLSTYENAMNRNRELISARDEFRILNEQLEARVTERTAALAAEVAERKRLQEREHHLNRVLTAIRNVNQLIVREKDPGRLIQQACEMLVETRGYRAVWIAVDGRSGSPSLVAQAGWGEAFEALSRRLREGKLPPCWEKARAAESGLAVLDSRETCHECPLWEAYGQDVAGVAPLRRGARDYGTLAICLASGARVEDEEAALLVEVASDLGLALHAMETERRRAAYAQIVASSQDAMALVDRRYVFEEANPSYARLVGREESAIVGHRVPEILGEDSFLRVVKPNLDRCFQGETVSFDTSREVSGLGSRFIEVQYSPCRASDGSVSAAAVSIRDITERKQAEAALAAAYSELERRVAERTAELSVANQELERFADAVSHDLRAPLRGIDGWSQAVLEDCGPQLDEQGHTYLKKVRSETQRMGELIDGLLELSRVIRAPMTRDTADLTAMAQEIEATLRAGEPGRAVDFVVAPGLVVQGDAVLLRAVLQNLLHNAWKFTGKRPRARIEVGCTSEQGQTVYHVRDDGAGFEMRYAGKLFAPFERLHSLEEFPGTGVGLATVQRIIHRHGGKMWATAQVDQGATFYFTLTA